MSFTRAVTGSLKALVPRAVKRSVKRALLERKFARAVRAIEALPPGRMPTRETLRELQEGWTNRGFAAKYDYLEEVAKRVAETDGPVLECGSGLTTVLSGLLAGRRGVETWSLEHIPLWRDRVAERLRRYRIRGCSVRLVTLRDYEGFSWYDPPSDLPAQFRLVICDGPPDSTPGGRYGLMPVLGERLPPGALILLDDAGRESESEVLRRWEAESKVSTSLVESPTGTFAVVTRL